MKKMIVLIGCPGSGKSHWIKENNYERFTLSMDTLRLMFSEPRPHISQEYNANVALLFYDLLEKRLKNGSFTVIDNCNHKLSYIKKLVDMGKEYDYEVEFIKFDPGIETCLERNRNREEYKKVPEEVVKRIYQSISNLDWNQLRPKDL